VQRGGKTQIATKRSSVSGTCTASASNIVTVFRVSIFEQFLPARSDGTWLDRVLHSILMIGIDLKAFALFSLLFGVGLAIQYDHLSGVTAVLHCWFDGWRSFCSSAPPISS